MTAVLEHRPCGYWEDILNRRERVVALTKAGRSASEIAAIEGVTRRTVVRIRSTAGVSAENSVHPMSADELHASAALLADGCSYEEVGRTLGRSGTVIRKHFPGHGWPPAECGRMAAANRWARQRAARMGVRL